MEGAKVPEDYVKRLSNCDHVTDAMKKYNMEDGSVASHAAKAPRRKFGKHIPAERRLNRDYSTGRTKALPVPATGIKLFSETGVPTLFPFRLKN